MSTLHVNVAGYTLGVLDEADSEAFEHHLHGCTSCQLELLELAPVPELLDLARNRPATATGAEAGTTILISPPRPSAGTSKRAEGKRPRRPGWSLAAAVLAAVVVFLGSALAAQGWAEFQEARDGTPARAEGVEGGGATAEEPTAEPSGDGADRGQAGATAPPVGANLTYRMTEWSDTSFMGEIVITNSGSEPLEGWKLDLYLTDARVHAAWELEWEPTEEGARLSQPHWEDGIAPGASKTVYFTAEGTPQTPGCALNGAPCGL